MLITIVLGVIALAALLRRVARDPPADVVSAAWLRARIRERRDG